MLLCHVRKELQRFVLLNSCNAERITVQTSLITKQRNNRVQFRTNRKRREKEGKGVDIGVHPDLRDYVATRSKDDDYRATMAVLPTLALPSITRR